MCTNSGVAVSFLSKVVFLRIFLSYVVQLKSLLGKELMYIFIFLVKLLIIFYVS